MKNPRTNPALILLLLAVLLVVIVRLRLLATPLERDEGEFAYAGQLLLQGIPPYKLFYNMKFPGIYAAYALMMLFFGQSPSGIHFGLLLVNLAAIWLLYRLARRFLDAPGAAAAAASYGLLSTSPVVMGSAAHATHFVVAAALAGLLLLLWAEDRGKHVLFFCGGFLMGMACLMKQPGAVFGLFGLCLLVARATSDGFARRTAVYSPLEPHGTNSISLAPVKDQPQQTGSSSLAPRSGERVKERGTCARSSMGSNLWRAPCQRIALYLAGLFTPLLLTAAILWQAGVFQSFWFWTIVYARVHAAEFGWSAGLRQLAWFFQHMPFTADGLFWIIAGLGLLSLALVKDERRKKLWLVGFFVFSFLAVSVSNYFSEHYFVMLLPALCLLVGHVVGAAAQAVRVGTRRAASGLFILICLLALFHHRVVFFSLSPDHFCKQFYNPNPFVECLQVGRYLREHASPGARIAVLGSEPEILFYARRHSATGYIYMYDFFVPQPFAEKMQRDMIAQIQEARPEYLVFVKQPVSWDLRGNFERLGTTPVMTWLPKFVAASYEPVGVVLLKPDPEYYWGREAAHRTPPLDPFIGILKRR
jgi:hypothetical protein